MGPNILTCPQSLENMTSIYCLGGYGLNRNFEVPPTTVQKIQHSGSSGSRGGFGRGAQPSWEKWKDEAESKERRERSMV